MKAYRLCEERHADPGVAFSGKGAAAFGGRWNPVGYPVVYASESLALAALEVLVHASIRQLQRVRFAYFEIAIPERAGIGEVSAEELPADWRAAPAPLPLQWLGARWLDAGRGIALRVPSVVVPIEHNLLLNPAHPDFKRLEIYGPHPFSLDARLAE